ncbi:archaetidylserine decarboxylase [Cytobacillus praedii]|uniref:archaetidylserine decarboxylase n=1 Tax=Cytobacillus praedii TaxID=1742358 RepID=UPI002E24D13C|nr:archaetidylserine decarboxylase [Cytobacillus praedii]MED3553910.1 archaetidylserine decarboxylase [Cytobacillus praedii]
MAIRRLFHTLTELTSHKWSSKLIGSFTKTRASRWLISWYSRAYGIHTEDAEKPLKAYQSLNEFFIRRLKDGIRPIDQNNAALVSPVDATITGIGRVDEKSIINVKGQNYTTDELLGSAPTFNRYRGGFFIVLYLSPANYHRVHSPVTGTIIAKNHILGRAYPVNEFGLKHMNKVLSHNERLITYMRHQYGDLSIVKVGAMNVSSIKYTNSLAIHLNKGDELAYFEFGSTVVLLVENGAFEFLQKLCLGTQVRVGEPLGYWGAGFQNG